MSRQPGWLALLLALFVISLCLSQRLGLISSCPASVHMTDAALPFDNSQSPADKPSSADSQSHQCSLSEQLLSKVWNQLEPILATLLLLLSLWLLVPRTGWYCRLLPPPQPYAGRRRHLVLCVFRE
ncbi:hypothetical protein [Oceanisphaera arctica]|uniref:Uncharacterized protein n=1 Tax=Oceanisphaera arctica TaxID=641510 RepID=A0A2P5TLD6_9GAMM|nr:hypothetical protein [Oceanisphaera arctica]PPL16101.1 hypothetical protein UN63_10270 [Oceanisphaera arctica]